MWYFRPRVYRGCGAVGRTVRTSCTVRTGRTGRDAGRNSRCLGGGGRGLEAWSRAGNYQTGPGCCGFCGGSCLLRRSPAPGLTGDLFFTAGTWCVRPGLLTGKKSEAEEDHHGTSTEPQVPAGHDENVSLTPRFSYTGAGQDLTFLPSARITFYVRRSGPPTLAETSCPLLFLRLDTRLLPRTSYRSKHLLPSGFLLSLSRSPVSRGVEHNSRVSLMPVTVNRRLQLMHPANGAIVLAIRC